MTVNTTIRSLPLALLIGLSLGAPLAAQSRDEPLGDILKSIEEATQPEQPPPPEPVPHKPVPPSGIGTTPLPPSRIDTPFGPPTPPPEEAEGVSEAEAIIGDVVLDEGEDVAQPELTEAERQAQWEAAERARLEALDRARAEREAARQRALEAAQAQYEQRLAEREAAIAEAETAYRAELERTQREAERNHAIWLERVRACRAGDRAACAQPSDYNY